MTTHRRARPLRLAFVTIRYGPNVLGGAETAVRELAEKLAERGDHVEVFATCTNDPRRWNNTLPAGDENINTVPVHRFPIRWTNRSRYEELLRGQLAKQDEQFEWLHDGPHSPEIYQTLARRAHEFDLLFFAPYLFSVVQYAAAIAPARSIIWPCLHDEPFAYFVPTQIMLRGSHGLMFNSEPERVFAMNKLGVKHPRAFVVGCGMRQPASDGERFRRKSGVTDPFVLYSGRLDIAKNVPLLIDYFGRYKKAHPGSLKLVLMGRGTSINLPDIIQIGFQPAEDKPDVFAAASVLCQPSVNESFSIVLMESWLAGTPVMVHGDCNVTRCHVTQSGGGLYFSNYDEFEEVLRLITANSDLNQRMGESGQRYVLKHYDWDAVLGRFDEAVKSWMP